MNKGWQFYLKRSIAPSELKRTLDVFLMDYMKHLDNDHYIYNKQPIERIAPGQERRAIRKERTRKVDREKVKEIISTIFKKKDIRYPPTTIRDLKLAEFIRDKEIE